MGSGRIGKIIICSTPIGNLDDISKRLICSLNDADVIYAEDTRVTSKLLNYLKVEKPIKRLDENIMDKHAAIVVDEAKSGEVIAYCTDAGTPGVSDPGLKLVEAARDAGVEVEVVPGPSALISAYVASGFTNQSFFFGGFLPRKENAQINYLKELANLNAVLIFYESAKRLVSTLTNIAEVFPKTEISVCRELTKLHEEINVGNSLNVLEDYKSREAIKGEIVICINNNPQNNSEDSDSGDTTFKLAQYLHQYGAKTGDISSALQEVFNISKNEAYEIALNVKK